jgi:taurine dioxygenase
MQSGRRRRIGISKGILDEPFRRLDEFCFNSEAQHLPVADVVVGQGFYRYRSACGVDLKGAEPIQKETVIVEQTITSPDRGAYGDLSVSLCSPALGARVTDVDIREVDERTLLSLRDVLLRYHVLVLPGQALDPAAQVAVADRLFPASPPHPLTDKYVEGSPQVVVLSNIVENGRPVGVSDAGQLWHSDVSFRTHPELFISLYAVEVPTKDGAPLGDTQFVSTAAAYDALSEDDKEYLSTLSVRHSYAFHLEKMRRLGLLRRPIGDNELDLMPDVVHSLIRTHPITGRKCIYVNESFCANVIGLEPEESDALIGRLCDHVVKPEFVFEQHWSKGDMVIWDNVVTQHRGVSNYGELRRRLHRVTTLGPVPEGPGDRYR